jgi:hypothetical protein
MNNRLDSFPLLCAVAMVAACGTAQPSRAPQPAESAAPSKVPTTEGDAVATYEVDAIVTGEAAAATCADAADHAVSVAADHFATEGEPLDAMMVQDLRELLFSECNDKEWSADQRRCVASAATVDAVDACDVEFSRAEPATPQEIARARTKELYDAVRGYYMATADAAAGPPHFPRTAAGPTPPLGACCAQGGICAPDAQQWETDEWRALGFVIDEPHYYSYQYVATNPTSEFTVRAIGDLDCDQDYATFEMSGSIDPAKAK